MTGYTDPTHNKVERELEKQASLTPEELVEYMKETPSTIYEYRMTTTGNVIAIEKGACPPLDSIYIGVGGSQEPPQYSAEEQYELLTRASRYDCTLYF